MARKKNPLLPRPLDVNEQAFRFVRMVTGEPVEDTQPDNRMAAKLGKRGGKVGGKARARKLTPERRAEIARKAARVRWGKE